MMNKKILTISSQSAFLDGQDPLRKWQPTGQKDLAEGRSRRSHVALVKHATGAGQQIWTSRTPHNFVTAIIGFAQ